MRYTRENFLALLSLIALASLMACREASQLKRAEAVEPSGAGFPRTLLDGGGSADRLFTGDGKPVFVFHRDVC